MAEECFQITFTNKKESKKEMRVEKNEFLFVQEIKYFLLKKKYLNVFLQILQEKQDGKTQYAVTFQC